MNAARAVLRHMNEMTIIENVTRGNRRIYFLNLVPKILCDGDVKQKKPGEIAFYNNKGNEKEEVRKLEELKGFLTNFLLCYHLSSCSFDECTSKSSVKCP